MNQIFFFNVIASWKGWLPMLEVGRSALILVMLERMKLRGSAQEEPHD